MKLTSRAARAALAALATVAIGGVIAASPAAAAAPQHHSVAHAVFVATDGVTGNKVVAYDRADDGSLSLAGTYDTGGVGGTLTGAVVDRTASQGALAIDSERGLLYAVNAGSNTVSVFSVRGSRLHLEQVVPSGGSFPSSVAVHGDLVEVLNSRDGGSIRGFRVDDGRLHRIAGTDRALGLNAAATPEFVNTPGQVTFTPDGSKVLVTTKANTHAIETFAVGRNGRLSATPVVTTFPGTVPFAITFDGNGHAVVAVAGSNAVVTATVNSDGTLTQIESDPTGQAATCWVVRVGDRIYVSNAGSGSLTGFDGDAAGHLTLIGNTSTGAGTIDAAATSDGRFIYVQTGLAGNIDGFSVNADGTLASVGSVNVPDAVGGEGIVTL